MISYIERILAKEGIINVGCGENTSTLMLFKCIERKYAEKFVEGKVYFGTPRNWIECEINGNKGRGDKLEGVFKAVKSEEKNTAIKVLNDSSDEYFFDDNGYTFFRRNSVLDLKCLCVYGLSDCFFEKTVEESGKAHYNTYISKEYFSHFSEYKSKDDYMRVNPDEQPVVIFIRNPALFFERIHLFMKSLDVEDEELIIAPVTYINWHSSYKIIDPSPRELLYKDRFFEEQREIRVIVNSNSQKYLDYIRCHTVFDIGSLDDIAEIHNYYFNDMTLELIGKNKILYNMDESKEFNIYDMNLFELLNVIDSYRRGSIEIIDHNGDTNKLSMQERIQPLIDHIKSKYGVFISIDKNKEMKVTLLDGELQQEFYKRYMTDRRSIFETRMRDMFDNKRIDEMITECIESVGDNEVRGAAFYYLAKAFFEKKLFRDAIIAYLYAYNNDYLRIVNGILFSIADGI